MTKNMKLSKDVAEAKALLEQHGYVVHKEASYRRAQERLRVAEARLSREEAEVEYMRSTSQARLEEERRQRDRCTFLYGQAMAHGATADELARDPESVRLANLSQYVSRIKTEQDITDLLGEIRNGS